MPLQINQTTMFSFSMPVGETTYSFNIPAKDRNEACAKLLAALETICGELNVILKPGPN